MKQRYMLIGIVCAIVLSLSACTTLVGSNTSENKKEQQKGTEEVDEPELSQIRSICELATLECYYHNVAKSTKTKGSGLSHLGEKERIFWIEYTGVAKIGIDMSEVKMIVDGTNVTITIPNAKPINYKVESISEDNYIYSVDSWFNKNPISGEEQTKAVNQAQEEMKLSVEKNTSLLVRAQDRAKVLIENYIIRLGEASGVSYQIDWEYGDKTPIANENIESSNNE
jgi:hypothetical protein